MVKPHNHDLALVLSGGGARAAYQVGFLLYIAKKFPDLQIPILTGVSSGAINAAFLANHQGSFLDAVTALADLWRNLKTDQVYRTDTPSLLKFVLRSGFGLVSGGHGPTINGLVDTAPLKNLLTKMMDSQDGRLSGVKNNLQHGRLKALAISGTNYGTGQSMTWVQGKNIELWERPHRRSASVDISVDHVLASASLPLFFPATRIGGSWFGDGGIRLSAPISPALHLGASKVMAISTRYRYPIEVSSELEAKTGPPLSRIIGTLMNAVFLDTLDEDARQLNKINHLLEHIPEDVELQQIPVNLFMLRPSFDLGELCSAHEEHLPFFLRYLLRGLSTRQSNSHDWLSMIMFDPEYLSELIQIGEKDAQMRENEIISLIE